MINLEVFTATLEDIWGWGMSFHYRQPSNPEYSFTLRLCGRYSLIARPEELPD
jgi:hypothetical protein